MNKDDSSKAGDQRIFQKGVNNFLLLHKKGKVIAFQLDENGNANVVDRQNDINFKLTGRALINDGWRCVGPGLEYSWLLK